MFIRRTDGVHPSNVHSGWAVLGIGRVRAICYPSTLQSKNAASHQATAPLIPEVPFDKPHSHAGDRSIEPVETAPNRVTEGWSGASAS